MLMTQYPSNSSRWGLIDKQDGRMVHEDSGAWQVQQTSHRDVNLPLFGGIPLFVFTFRFFQNYFPFFWKIAPKKKKKIINDTATIASVRIASVNSRWRLGLPVCAFFPFRSKFESAESPLSGRSHAACWRIAWADGGRSRSDHKSFALRTPAFAHPPFPHSSHTHTHTHTHSLSLCLSLSHTHTHHWYSGLPAATIST